MGKLVNLTPVQCSLLYWFPSKYYSFSANHAAISLASSSSIPNAGMLPVPLMIISLSSASEKSDPALLMSGPAPPDKSAP